MKNSLFFLLLLTVVSGYTGQSQEFIKQLNALFADELKSDEPGGAVLLKKGNRVVFQENYGLADLKTREQVNEHTIFNTGSISKTFVAYAILILEEQEKLSLEDPIAKYFPDFKDKEIANKVKIKHLLSHTSGLPDARNVQQNQEFYLTAKDKENFEPIKGIANLNFEPGTQFQYSNPAFNGLALIIEQVSQQPWQKFIKENIFDPAGMTRSKITNGSYPDKDVAHAYYYDNGYAEYDYGEFPTFAAAGNGGIWCSILDLAKYEQAIQEYRFLREAGIKKSRTIFSPINWSASYQPFLGYSWFTDQNRLLRNENEFDESFVYHTGSQGGFRAFYIALPEKDVLFVGLFNKPLDDMNQLLRSSLKLLEENNWLDQ